MYKDAVLGIMVGSSLQGEHAQAVKSLQEYIALCQHVEQVQPEAQAFCSLADCQQVLGNLEGAVQSLQSFLLQSRHHDVQVSMGGQHGEGIC